MKVEELHTYVNVTCSSNYTIKCRHTGEKNPSKWKTFPCTSPCLTRGELS